MSFEKWVQTRLNVHGASIVANGDWGRFSIEALKTFQKRYGVEPSGVTDSVTVKLLSADPDKSINGVTAEAPEETMPPYMAELYRRMGLHEARDNALLTTFLKIGRYLGNPKDLPWCGDGLESAISKTLPSEPLLENPFWAQGWANFGRDVVDPIVGCILVFKWTATTGHVTVCAGVDGDNLYGLGCNQANSINISTFKRGTTKKGLIACRWPTTYPIKKYPPLKGRSVGVATEGSTR